MLGSRMGAGRELPNGDRSWLSKSVSSLVICLFKKLKIISLLT